MDDTTYLYRQQQTAQDEKSDSFTADTTTGSTAGGIQREKR